MIQPVESTSSPISTVEASLAAVAKRQRRVLMFAALLKTVSTILALLLPLAIVAALPVSRILAWRMIMTFATLASVFATAWLLIRPALRRGTLLQFARDIERRFPSIEERLSTALAPAPPAPLAPSRSLHAHVAREAVARLATLPLAELIPASVLRTWTIALLIVAVTWAAILLAPASRRPVAAGLYRITHPLNPWLPDSLADLTGQPGEVALLEGDQLIITANSSADSPSLAIQPDAAPTAKRLMQRVAPARWQATVEDVRESFRYRIRTAHDQTPWYRVTVTPRPSIESLTLRYDYPAYTALPPKAVTALDAGIDALAGTRVTLTLRTSQPLDLNASRVVIHSPQAQSLPFTARDAGEYQSTLTVTQNGTFSFDLVNPSGIHSRPTPPTRITARPDQIPSVVLQSLDYTITARPDDTIPVQFLASDDFGVMNIDCLVRLDGSPPKSQPIPFDRPGLNHVSGPDFPLDLSNVLPPATADAPHDLIYQLRVTDNRSPSPQSALSARRQVHIDPQQIRSYQGQLDQSLGKTLTDIIASTVKELDRAKPRLLESRTRDGSEPLGEWQRRELHTAAHDLPDLDIRLTRSAAQPGDKTFEPVTRAMTEIAQGPLRTAAEQSVRADLNADDWQQRNDAIIRATAAINSARESLQKLLDSGQIEHRCAQAEAARDLEAARNLQKASLDAIRAGKLKMAAQFQARALNRLRQAMQESPELRDPSNQRLADQLQDLERALQDLARRTQLPPDQLAQLQQQLKNLADASAQAAASLQQSASAMNLALSSPGAASSSARPTTTAPQPATAGPSGPKPPGGPLPASIRDLGISPEQWLKLSPEAQRDVLSTSEQQGPPAYRPLIQDYYIKLSQMPAPNGAAK